MRTIGATLRAATARVPSRPAQVFGDSSYSYSELDAVVDRVAGVLAERGTASSLTGRTSAQVRLASCCFAARPSRRATGINPKPRRVPPSTGDLHTGRRLPTR